MIEERYRQDWNNQETGVFWWWIGLWIDLHSSILTESDYRANFSMSWKSKWSVFAIRKGGGLLELNELSRFLTKIDFFPEINVVTSLINHFIQNASDTFCKELCRSLVGESIFQERHCDDGDEKNYVKG